MRQLVEIHNTRLSDKSILGFGEKARKHKRDSGGDLELTIIVLLITKEIDETKQI